MNSFHNQTSSFSIFLSCSRLKRRDATFISASKSSTGTVILVIEDVNDNKPTLPSAELLICEKEGERGSTVVVAEDKDAGHFSAPFSFSLPPDNDGKWSVESLNGRWRWVSAQAAGKFE